MWKYPSDIRVSENCIAIILMGKRELVALLYLSPWCLVMAESRLVRIVIYFPTMYAAKAKARVKIRGYTGSSEP